MSLGPDTLCDVMPGADGKQQPRDAVLREVVEQAVVADQTGIDLIGLGNHHRDDFAISAPEIVLAAVVGQTSRIRRGTGVTVLSTDDPVQMSKRFASQHAVSNGRAGPSLGRGSFFRKLRPVRA